MAATRFPWTPSGLVTLLTDFGVIDPYVGIMKGVLHRTAPGLREAIDLTHAVEPQDVAAGSFFLRHSWSWFPPGTVHVAVVDPGVGSRREILVALDQGHAFLAPDNGLLERVLSPEARVCRLDLDRFGLAKRSRTFHGRDVFAPTAARLAAGEHPLDCGDEHPLEVQPWASEPEALAGEDRAWRGEVLLADRFGNLVTNFSEALVGERRPEERWEVEVAGRRVPLHRTYAEVEEGELLALVDSFDLVEVAQRNGSALEALGEGRGTELILRRTS